MPYFHDDLHYLTNSSFHVGNPEGIHQLMILFSDRSMPESVRHMNAYSGHTYKFTKAVGQNTRFEITFTNSILGWFIQLCKKSI